MLRVLLEVPTLPNSGEEVTGTRYQIATDSTFNTILGDVTTANQLEFYSTTLDVELVPNTKYYVRAMYFTNLAGAEGWGNVTEFTATNVVENIVTLQPPIMTLPPEISIKYMDNNYTPISGIIFDLTGDTINNDTIISVDFVIEDMFGNAITSMNITKGFRDFRFDYWLSPNTMYIARASTKNNTGYVSDFGSIVFVTSKEMSYSISSFSMGLNEAIANYLYDISNHIRVELHSYSGGIIKTENITDGSLSSIFTEVEFDESFFVRMAPVISGTIQPWVYSYKMNKECMLPISLPVELGCK